MMPTLTKSQFNAICNNCPADVADLMRQQYKASPKRGKKRGEMNDLERDFSRLLAVWREIGLVRWYQYESMRLLLPGGVYYTPDFPCWHKDFGLTFYEVKGFRRDGGRVRLRVAAGHFKRFTFFEVHKTKTTGWDFEHVSRGT